MAETIKSLFRDYTNIYIDFHGERLYKWLAAICIGLVVLPSLATPAIIGRLSFNRELALAFYIHLPIPIISYLLLRTKGLRPASIFLLSTEWLLVSILLFYSGGLINIITLGYINLILIGGIFLAFNGVVLALSLSLFSGVLLTFWRLNNVLPTPVFVFGDEGYWIALMIFIFIAFLFIVFAFNLVTLTNNLRQNYVDTIAVITKALEARDGVTGDHTQRVVNLTMELVERAGIPAEQHEAIRRGAYLHDIGKIGIPDAILNKPGKLNAKEWEIMKTHPLIAKDLLEQVPFLEESMNIPLYHHEKWDGTGYPFGLKVTKYHWKQCYSLLSMYGMR